MIDKTEMIKTIANEKIVFEKDEKEARAAELVIANEKLVFEKDARAAELVIANEEKEERAAELVIAKKKLVFEKDEKEARAAELVIAKREKGARAADLIIANEKLITENNEKDARAAELVIANEEKDERAVEAAELIVANEEKDERAAELVIANEKISATLEEKEVLLKEIHHRVKNNLQVIKSMLSLQERAETDAHTIEALGEAQRRVLVMAQIHETLHQSDDMSSINAKEYIDKMMQDFSTTYGGKFKNISMLSDIDDITFKMDRAIPCGQIISELLSNCLKHAFPDDQTGNIEVHLKRGDGDEIELAVIDDGKGLPEDFDIEKAETLGMKLVQVLTKQMGGILVIDGSKGTRVQITFKEDKS